MRLSLGRSSLLAAAAVAGAFVYWRATDRRRSRHLEEIDEAISEGRDVADSSGGGEVPDDLPFDQR
jgi:Flp pilus assembly protein TadB